MNQASEVGICREEPREVLGVTPRGAHVIQGPQHHDAPLDKEFRDRPPASETERPPILERT
jgi:hypothetical protein